MTLSATWEETGLEVLDLADGSVFAGRPVQKHDALWQLSRLQQITHAFVDRPEGILQELVNAAVEMCGADSAGISLVQANGTDSEFYHWVATAGEYSPFFDAKLPRFPSACGITLERGGPQLFRVGQKFFDILGVNGPLVKDGLLLPWNVDGVSGTIFIMAHGRDEAFDAEHCRIMEVLADFAAMGVRQAKQQEQLREKAADLAASAMAHHLAHRINNPLQSLTNVLFLASEGHHGPEAKEVGTQALGDLQRLSALVKELLALPYREVKEIALD